MELIKLVHTRWWNTVHFLTVAKLELVVKKSASPGLQLSECHTVRQKGMGIDFSWYALLYRCMNNSKVEFSTGKVNFIEMRYIGLWKQQHLPQGHKELVFECRLDKCILQRNQAAPIWAVKHHLHRQEQENKNQNSIIPMPKVYNVGLLDSIPATGCSFSSQQSLIWEYNPAIFF